MGYKMVTFWLTLKDQMHFIIHLKLPSIEDVVVTLAPVGVGEGIAIGSVCLYVCLFVCPRAYLKNYWSDLLEIFTQVGVYPWLGPPLR